MDFLAIAVTMKIAAFSLVLMLTVSVHAQIPENVLSHFDYLQPAARFVEWRVEKSDQYRVTYTSGFRQSLVFDSNARILISESELPPDYIPKAINEFIANYLKGFSSVVWDSFDEKNQRSYFILCNENRKLSFTNDGEFIAEYLIVKKKTTGLVVSTTK